MKLKKWSILALSVLMSVAVVAPTTSMAGKSKGSCRVSSSSSTGNPHSHVSRSQRGRDADANFGRGT